MSEDEFDDDEWIELEKVLHQTCKLKPCVTVTLSKNLGKNTEKEKRARAIIWLRREAAEWITRNEPRFKIQIGGPFANKIRIVPEARAGRFESGDFKGSRRIMLGIVNIWPDEQRSEVEAKYQISANAMILTLPPDFARAAPIPPKPMEPPKAVPKIVSSPAPAEKKVAVSRADIEQGNRDLQQSLGLTRSIPHTIGGVRFSPSEALILEVLLKREEASKEALLIATHDAAAGDDERDPKLIDVFICRLRPKLKQFGIEIENIWGGRFKMAAHSKAILWRLIERGRDGDAA